MRGLTTQTAESIPFEAPTWVSLNTRDGILEAITRALARPVFTGLDCGEIFSSRLLNIINSGTQPLSGTPITLLLNTLTGPNDTLNYTASSGEIQIESDGIYLINVKVTTNSTSGTRSIARSFIEVNTGSGFTKVDGSDLYNYNRISSAGEQTSSHLGTYSISKGTLIRIRSEIESGSGIQTVTDSCQLSILPVDVLKSSLNGHSYDCGILETPTDPQILINCGDLS
jgi:hypothetical protein